MKRLATAKTMGFALLGLGLFGIALSLGDLQDMTAALADVGWQGALGLAGWRTLPVALCAWGLWAIVPSNHKPQVSLSAALGSRLARDGVAALLPVLPAGGEMVSARMLCLNGLSAAPAMAATVADLTLEIAAQALFSGLGFILLLLAVPGNAAGNWGGLALALPLCMMAGLGLLQHPKIAAWLSGMAIKLAGTGVSTQHLTQAIAATYSQKRKVLLCALLHFAGWLIGVGEAWLALRWMGHGLPLANVVALESVVFAVKGIAFMVPWSIGIQEGGYMALGAALGLPPDIALGLSLLKRLPDVALGIPGIALWQWAERGNRRAAAPIEA